MKDVARYVDEYKLVHYTSLKILMMAEEQNRLIKQETQHLQGLFGLRTVPLIICKGKVEL